MTTPAELVAEHARTCPVVTRLDSIGEKLDDIHARLFIGNGVPPFATRLDRLEQSQSRHQWWLGIIAAAVLGGICLVAVERYWPEKHSTPTALPASPAVTKTAAP